MGERLQAKALLGAGGPTHGRAVTGLVDFRHARWQDTLPALTGRADLVICDPIYEDPDLSYLQAAADCVRPGGALYVFGDCSGIAPTKVALDAMKELRFENWLVMGPQDWGGRSPRRWGQKHDDLLFYTRRGAPLTFNAQAVGVPKATAGTAFSPSGRDWKIPHSVWSDVSTLSTMSNERVRDDHGRAFRYQKPWRVIERIVLASSNPQDLVVDAFGGVATVPAVCLVNGRRCVSCEADERPYRAGVARLAALGAG